MQGVHLRKYGEAATIPFELYEVDGVDFRVDWTPATGDVFMMRDEAAEEQVTNAAGNADLSTLVTDGGHGYSITLALEDMQAARIVIYFVDQVTKVFLDKPITIETYGNPSAQHAMDFDDSVRGGMTALPNAAADAAGGLPISDAGELDLDVQLANTNEITAARMGALTDWINDGRLDLILDAIATDAARLTAARAAVLTDWINNGRLDLILDLINAKTTNLPSSPAAVGSEMTLENDAIKAAKYDESTAFPLKANDVAATQIARVGADGDTLETLSDQIDAIPTTAMRGTDSAATEAKQDIIGGIAAAILVDTNRVDGLIEDSGGDRFTEKSLEEAPSASGAGTATVENQEEILENQEGLETSLTNINTKLGAQELSTAGGGGGGSDDSANAGDWEVVYDSSVDGVIGTAEQEIVYGATSFGMRIKNAEESGSKTVKFRFSQDAADEKFIIYPGIEEIREPSRQISVFVSASAASTNLVVQIRKANT